MKPSIKAINERLGTVLAHEYEDTRRYARLIRECMDRANTPREVDNELDNINTMLKGYGVESIRDNEWSNYYLDTGLLYVNMGDTYTTTIVYDTRKKNWYVTDWGTIVENNEKRFNA